MTGYSQWMTPDARIIYPSRGKLLLMACGCTGFVVLGVFLYQTRDSGDRIVGLIAISFFGLGLAYTAIRLMRRTPALIIHPAGIFDNSSAIAAGFLRWDEISGLFAARISNQPFLAIAVNDVEEFLSRQPAVKARLLRVNIRLVGAPVAIPARILPMSLEALIQEIQAKCPSLRPPAT